jgi:hypothetical protein
MFEMNISRSHREIGLFRGNARADTDGRAAQRKFGLSAFYVRRIDGETSEIW